MKMKSKKLIPLGVAAVLALVALVIKFNPPETPQWGGAPSATLAVDIQIVKRRDYQIKLQSYGTVQPRTKSTLVAQVSGQIMSVNPNVRDGGFFEKGDVLGSIDARDYEADVRISEATLMDARQALAEAEARTVQAREDWGRLGNTDNPSDLVLRLPQLDAAKARIVSAESSLQKAELELERTQIVAPFAGRVLQKLVDVGQVVSSNTPLAEIYATDYVEIRLPLKNQELGFIDLPERYRNSQSIGPSIGQVKIVSELFTREVWDADLVRTEGAIDEAARQLHVIAQIKDPFASSNEGRAALKIGQYVTAELAGKVLKDSYVIPNAAIYQGTYVYVVVDGILLRRDIDIIWQNDVDSVIGNGLEDGDELVTTPLGAVTSGIRVSIAGEENGSPAQQWSQGSDASNATGSSE
jgi:RND family efflux transporter MFP subunit